MVVTGVIGLVLLLREHSDELSRVGGTPFVLLGVPELVGCLTRLASTLTGIFNFREAVGSLLSWLTDINIWMK